MTFSGTPTERAYTRLASTQAASYGLVSDRTSDTISRLPEPEVWWSPQADSVAAATTPATQTVAQRRTNPLPVDIGDMNGTSCKRFLQ
ncbi:hypothetical protein GCM10023147_11630 [Tsukamurella soli]|uniref:Uncharacterized protein n=1 Tax=Tsukamurella soli TaxID=644556 RepID=A0ABP8J9N4_9ACTN